MISPVIQASSNCSWVAALAIGVLCLTILYGMEKLDLGTTKSGLLAAVQWLWMLLVVSEFLHWTMLSWPNHGNYYVVPLTIVALAALALRKGRSNAATVAAIVFWVIAFMLGAVLISGVREIRWENWKPQWKMQTANYIVVLLVPAMVMGRTTQKGKWKMPLLGLVTCAVTSGVMSVGYIARSNAPFYEMSRTISLLGVGNRFESLAATGLTMGYFVLVTLLLDVMVHAWEHNRTAKYGVWVSAGFGALVFLSGMRINSRLLAVGTLGVWVVIPIIEKIAKYVRKPIDK